MGFFGDSDGEEMDFGKHSGLFMMSLKLLGKAVVKPFKDLRVAQERAKMQAAAERLRNPEPAAPLPRLGREQKTFSAIARPNLAPPPKRGA